MTYWRSLKHLQNEAVCELEKKERIMREREKGEVIYQ